MTRLLIAGGRQRMEQGDTREWNLFEEAQLVELDTETGESHVRLRYQSPPGRCPIERPSHVFKAGTDAGDTLLLTTQTEVLVVDRATLQVLESYSDPSFNDLHHVARFDGRLHVVSTGLDSLIVLDEYGAAAEYRHALGEDIWSCFDPQTDYRLVETTKPHRSHPNFVFRTEHGTWVTRFNQRDAICLDDPRRVIKIEAGIPHDGHTYGDGTVWFTTVNGHVVHAHLETCEVIADYDLNLMDDRETPLGWCRGLLNVNGIAYVGFSQFRQTQFRRNVSWVRHGFRRVGPNAKLPTRVMAFDLERGRRVGEWALTEARQDAIFSLFVA